MATTKAIRRRRVAICVWDEVELLDFAGPGEVFAAAGDARAFRVYTVSALRQPVLSQGFVHVLPQYSIRTCPRPHVLVLPGGGGRAVLANRPLTSWIRETCRTAEIVLSVCTGAMVLAALGLLDNLEATTWNGAIPCLRAAAPNTIVHRHRRFIDNGQIVTSAGVSAGIDAALHVVSRLCGRHVATETARYMEYARRVS